MIGIPYPHIIPPMPHPVRYEFNIGGPMSREEKQGIHSTLLGRDGGFIHCPRVCIIGLSFKRGKDPVETIYKLMAEEGATDPEEYRRDIILPESRLMCREIHGSEHCLDVNNAARRDVLFQALMLGLSTSLLYDPVRPVLWTASSLTRILEIFEPAGFYA